MKRIAIVAHGLSDGGAERVAALLANKFYEIGNKVLFVAVYSDERVYKLNDGVKYTYAGDSNNRVVKYIKRSFAIDNAITKFHSDIIISFIINEMLLSSIKRKIPIVYSLRIDPHKTKNKTLCNFSYSRSKTVVFQTPDARDYYNDKIRAKGVVIGNPITPNLPSWDNDKFEKRIITACRLTEQKNLPMLIKGFYDFSLNHQDYSLWIYGKGELRDMLINYSDELGIGDKVHFPGYTSNIHDEMAKSAVFTLTSDYEGVSNSMLEALAIGVPTICTDCPPGGAALFIHDHINGILIPVGDSKALSKALSEIVDNYSLAEQFSNNSKIISEELTEDKIIEKWMEII